MGHSLRERGLQPGPGQGYCQAPSALFPETAVPPPQARPLRGGCKAATSACFPTSHCSSPVLRVFYDHEIFWRFPLHFLSDTDPLGGERHGFKGRTLFSQPDSVLQREHVSPLGQGLHFDAPPSPLLEDFVSKVRLGQDACSFRYVAKKILFSPNPGACTLH